MDAFHAMILISQFQRISEMGKFLPKLIIFFEEMVHSVCSEEYAFWES